MMAGLLGDFEDPRQQGLLALGLGLLNSRGNLGQGLGQAGMQAMDVMRQATQDQQRRKVLEQQQQMQALQMQAAQQQLAQQQQEQARRAAIEQAYKGAIRTPEQMAMAGGGGPTMANAAAVPNTAPGFDQAALIRGLSQADPMAAYQMMQPKPEDMKVVGDALLGVSGGKVRELYKSAPKEDLNSLIVRGPDGKPTLNQMLLDAKRLIAKEGAPSTSLSVNTGQKGLDNTLKLRGDFRSEPVYKAHQEMQSAYAQIDQSLKQATPAGDLAAATKIMKLLDPGSVVRESELGMAMAATGLMDRATNYANMIVTGQKLTPKQRVEFKQLADALYSESVGQYNAKRSEYEGIASRNGLSVPDVLGPVSDKPLPKPAQKQPARAMQKNVVVDF